MSEQNSPVLLDGDRVVFLGDSITEQQLYTNFVETYLVARHPEMRLSFFNAGWGGDTATGGLARLDRDVLSLAPNLVTVCYGMNDGRYSLPDPAVRAEFAAALRGIVARLRGAGARVVLLTPGMVDVKAAPHLESARYNMETLRGMADEVLHIAREEGLPCADLHQLMNDVNARARAIDPDFCMIPDGIHPDPAGHLVMAHGLLEALGVAPASEWIEIDIDRGAVVSSPGLSVSSLEPTADGPACEINLSRPPFPIDPSAWKVLPYLPFRAIWDSLLLRLRGGNPGKLLLRAGRLLGAPLPPEVFGEGIELFDHWRGQPLLHAELLYRITEEKDRLWFRIWRNLALDPGDANFSAPELMAAGVGASGQLEEARRSYAADHCGLVGRLEFLDTETEPRGLAELEFIAPWCLLGPFPRPWHRDFLGGEAAFTRGVPELGLGWKACDLDTEGLSINLSTLLGWHQDCFVYAVTVLRSPIDQEAELLLGSDDGVVAWMGGKEIVSNPDTLRPLVPDQERRVVWLARGDTTLLLKITQATGAWGFSARFSGLKTPLLTLRPSWKPLAPATESQRNIHGREAGIKTRFWSFKRHTQDEGDK
jgi:lysophospholipase L1-like esterase